MDGLLGGRMKRGENTKTVTRDVKRNELKRYIAEHCKVRHILKNIEALEDIDTALDGLVVTRLNYAITHRLALLKKYMPDEKSVELKNADGETFKSDSKWTVEFINAETQD
jgi:hypothetical protein